MNDSILEPSLSAAPVQMKQWRRWLLAFDCYNFSTNTLFISAIWVVYLASHGYSPLAIGLFEMLFHVAKFLAEMPTGIFADLIGRKRSLIIYCVLSAIDSLLFLFPVTLSIALAFMLNGIAIAFRAGATEALLWGLAGYPDRQQQERRYSRLISRMLLLGLLGELIGTASGGYLGHILQSLPFLCRILFCLLSIIPLLFIPEQRGIQAHQERPHPLRHFVQGLHVVWQTPPLMGLLCISALITSCWQTIYFYYQLYLHNQGFSLDTIGLIVALSTGSNFLFTAMAPFFMRRLSERWLVIVFVLVEIVGLLMMSLQQAIVGVIGYLILFQMGIAVLDVAISTYANKRSPEAQRATVLSFGTGLFSAAMIVLFPLFGLGVSHIPYTVVYAWTCAIMAVGSIIIALVTWRRSTRRIARDVASDKA